MTAAVVSLSDLFQIGSSKRVLKSQWKADGVPFYRGREVTRLAMDGFVNNELFIAEDHYTELANQYGVPKAGDIVITAIGTIGNSYIVQEGDRFYFKDASVLWLKKTSNASSQFVNLWLKSPVFFDQLNRGNGATVDTLTIQKLQSVQIRIPSVPEQHRIVAILDAAFDGIATAKANAEQNLQNARALFESHLQAVFTERGEGWKTAPLGEIAAFRNGINFTKSSKGAPIKILGVKDFQNHYWAPFENFDSIVPDGVVPDTDTLIEGDIVFVRSNGNPDLIGRCLLIAKLPERTTHSGFTIKARLQSNEVMPAYLCHFLKSNGTRQEMIDGGNGANIKSLNQGTLSRIVVPFPSLSKQAEIVGCLESMQAETQRLESLYRQKLAALDELKKSLLHQAFSGAL